MTDMDALRRPYRSVAFGVAVALAVAGTAIFAGKAWSQASANPEVRALVDRVERLQRDLNTLQRQVYQGRPAPAAPPPGAAATPVPGAPTFAAEMQVRLDDLESQIRSLTGRLEETNHAIGELARKLELATSDIELRLKQIEAGTPIRPLPGAPTAAGAIPPATPAPAAPGVLGTLSGRDLEAGPPQQPPAQAQPQPQPQSQPEAGPQAAALPSGTPEEQYRYATAYLSRSAWADAERALTAFLDAHPKHELAGNAQYWIGETHYVRGDFNNAALAFAKGYKDFPKSQKGPDNLLKLGMSLAALKRTDSACATFDRFGKDFPNAAADLKTRVASERKKLRCG